MQLVKKVSRFLKMIGLTILGLIGLILIIGIIFINLSPQFGKTPSSDQITTYSQFENHKDGLFVNKNSTPMKLEFWKLVKKMMAPALKRTPSSNITVTHIDSINIADYNSEKSRLIWFGHSTFLLHIDGKIILIDPMFGDSPSPISFIGTKRYSNELPIEIEKLPFIDAVILSHDHYDHLDYGSIQRLKGKVGRYFTPLGVGNHLISWGIDASKIHELNWWNSVDFDDIELVCTPSRHFSGRGLFDRHSTLWSSWVIKGTNDNIYFSGDGGYDDHFKTIGEKYGPFDIALMECGQYNEEWKLIHMSPEETAQAAVDVKAKLMMPIHWGAFTLAFHDWTDPIERLSAKAKELNMPLTTPKIGEPLIIKDSIYPTSEWWKEFSHYN